MQRQYSLHSHVPWWYSNFKKPNITVKGTCTEVQTGSHCARILNQGSAIGTEVDDIQINLILTPMDCGSCILGYYKSGNW